MLQHAFTIASALLPWWFIFVHSQLHHAIDFAALILPLSISSFIQ